MPDSDVPVALSDGYSITSLGIIVVSANEVPGQACVARLSSPPARRATPATIGWTGLASPEGR